MRGLVGILAMILATCFGMNAVANPEPELSGTWDLNCLDGYKKIVSAMDPKLVPTQLANGFEVAENKLSEKLYAKKRKAYLKGVPTVPWLTIYNKDLKPIYHAVGYNSRSDALWQLVIDQNVPTEFAPALYEIEPYSGIRAVDLPDADFTFVEYFANWCTNCKLQANALADFKSAHPKQKITHVRINADTAKMQKKKHTSKACPVGVGL